MSNAPRSAPFDRLLPAPRALHQRAGRLTLVAGTRYLLEASADAPLFARESVRAALEHLGLEHSQDASCELSIGLWCGSGRGLEGQAYTLAVSGGGIRIDAASQAGLLHGSATLVQLLALCAQDRCIPCVHIKDAPALERRGWMVDVSRNRVPTMETLKRWVDLLAALKGNELQLYTEHTFAYRGHEEVWKDSSPLTSDDMRHLDAYCAARGVLLVPNQNCLGHLHRWLRHERYRCLAEVPGGVEHPFSLAKEPFSLCPSDPQSLSFVLELLDQLLECCRSSEVNVGLDETFDLGWGRSKKACQERGVRHVYLEFLRALFDALSTRGRRMQFWADILLQEPALASEVPKGAIALLWGYEAAHPFGEQARVVANSGLAFHVCPGTSSWQSIAGRTGNMIANVDAAVRAARTFGARGLLLCDWGDRGHLQPEWASYAGWALASALAWNDTPPSACDPRQEAQLARFLDTHVFADEAGEMGTLALSLGHSGEVSGARAENASPLFALLTSFAEPFPSDKIEGLSAAGLERAMAHVEAALLRLPQAASRRADADLLADEFTWAGDMLCVLGRLGLARLEAPGPIGAMVPETRRALASQLGTLVEQFRVLWRARSRPGGLEHSVLWIERLRHALQ